MKAVILCRVSSKEQEESGYSLPAQETLLRKYADDHALGVVKVFSISESAKASGARKLFHEMLHYVKAKKVQSIVAEKVDRVTRELRSGVEIDDWLEADAERQLHLVKDSLVLHKNSRSQDKLNWGLRIILAKNYVDNLSEEVEKGWNEKIAQGHYPGHAKFGYKGVLEGKHIVQVQDPEMTHWVTDMFREFDSGLHSLRSLADLLYRQGLRTKSGRKVGKTNIQRYLSDPIYIGVFEWHGKQYPGVHEPLISKEQFNRVQERLTGKAIQVLTKHDYLFKGLITCANCGLLITWEEHKGIVYGHCNGYRGCPRREKWVREQAVVDALLSEFDKLVMRKPRLRAWFSDSLRKIREGDIVRRERVVAALQQRYNRVVQNIDQIYEDKLEGIINRELYDSKKLRYVAEKEALSDQIHKQSLEDDAQQDIAAEIFDLCQEGARLFKRRRTPGRRKLIRQMFSSLLLDGTVFTAKMTDQFAYLANLIEETNGSQLEAVIPTENSIFELDDSALFTDYEHTKTGPLKPVCPAWRERWDTFRTLFGTDEAIHMLDMDAQ